MPKEKETKAQKETRLASSFAEFWKEYPRKENKKPCFSLWVRLDPSKKLVTKIIDVVERYKLTYQWSRKEFIPMPSTFISQERWDNEVPAPMKKPGGHTNTRGAEEFVKHGTIVQVD